MHVYEHGGGGCNAKREAKKDLVRRGLELYEEFRPNKCGGSRTSCLEEEDCEGYVGMWRWQERNVWAGAGKLEESV